MHIPVEIKIICNQDDIRKIKEFLTPNKLIHIMDVHDVETTDKTNITLDISGIIFDDEDIRIIEKGLKHYGDVKVIRGKVKIFTLNTILSALVVAGIVSLALLAHNFNEEFYKEVFEHHNSEIILKAALIIGLSAVAGFCLELLIVYRERKITHY